MGDAGVEDGGEAVEVVRRGVLVECGGVCWVVGQVVYKAGWFGCVL